MGTTEPAADPPQTLRWTDALGVTHLVDRLDQRLISEIQLARANAVALVEAEQALFDLHAPPGLQATRVRPDDTTPEYLLSCGQPHFMYREELYDDDRVIDCLECIARVD
jgi:hypothetical protein